MLKLLAQTKSRQVYFIGLLISLSLFGCGPAIESSNQDTSAIQTEATASPEATEAQAVATEEPTLEPTEPPSGFDCDGVTDISESECQALVAFYNSTTGPNWDDNTNWLSAETPCTWYGVECTTEGVTSLDLSNNGLIGLIPPELGQLTNLTALNLPYNDLNGSLPAEIGQLTELSYLDLRRNQLSGAIPPELGSLSKLDTLYLLLNEFSGPLPAELGNLSQVTIFWLYDNQLSGPLPVELSNLPRVESIWLGKNQFSGPIPPELGQLKTLSRLNLAKNQLSGTIPPELNGLTRLIELDLSSNQLTGSLPPELSMLSALDTLSLENNQLTGAIPNELDQLANLSRLNLNNNQLSGPIPAELSQLTRLSSLWLANNQLSGDVPDGINRSDGLLDPALHGNQLNGTIFASNNPKTEVTYEGWRFSYDTPLAQSVWSETLPPITAEGTWVGLTPERIRFTLSNAPSSASFHQAQIYIYPVEELVTLRDNFQERFITPLGQVLADKSTNFVDEFFYVPPMSAGPNIESVHIKHLDFQGGSGVRFLNQYLQDTVPVSNQGLVYTFRGLTDDEQYYIAATFPVSHIELPEDIETGQEMIAGGDWEKWRAISDSYLAETVEQLKALDEASFSPDLTVLDELLQTLEFDPTQTTRLEGLAQIEAAEINFSETTPLQASVTVRGQLPDGCPISRTRQTNQDDNLIQLKFFTAPPAEATCDQAGASFEETVPLDLSRLAVDTYTLEVNQTIVTFDLTVEMLQVTTPACPLPTADQLVYLSPTEGYCLLHPAEVKVDTSLGPILQLISSPPPEGDSVNLNLTIGTDPAQGRTLDEVVADHITQTEEAGFLVEQEPITIGEQTGVLLTTDGRSIAHLLYNDVFYTLISPGGGFGPGTESGARSDKLWSTVLSSFTFIE